MNARMQIPVKGVFIIPLLEKLVINVKKYAVLRAISGSAAPFIKEFNVESSS